MALTRLCKDRPTCAHWVNSGEVDIIWATGSCYLTLEAYHLMKHDANITMQKSCCTCCSNPFRVLLFSRLLFFFCFFHESQNKCGFVWHGWKLNAKKLRETRRKTKTHVKGEDYELRSRISNKKKKRSQEVTTRPLTLNRLPCKHGYCLWLHIGNDEQTTVHQISLSFLNIVSTTPWGLASQAFTFIESSEVLALASA